MIKASGLTKTYGKKKAVDNLSFDVELGKVTGFLGPNGAGKSTTMRLMLGLDNGSGTTTYDDKPLQSYERPSQVIGILLDAKAFHPTRSARNHLRVLAALGGLDDKRVDEVLDIVGLTEVARKKPGTFSLGMCQRLGIAAAILSEPKYLLLDEPANGLDPEGIVWLRTFLEAYASKGNAVFISSHLLSEIALMADNVVVIGKGKLITSTTMKQLEAGNKHSYAFIRSDNESSLEKALKQLDKPYEKVKNGFAVYGATTDEVGEAAFHGKVLVRELSSQSSSLEDIFLELTADAQEYSAHKDSGTTK
jgi:ABC-2 type transport system ATP-binding protein